MQMEATVMAMAMAMAMDGNGHGDGDEHKSKSKRTRTKCHAPIVLIPVAIECIVCYLCRWLLLSVAHIICVTVSSRLCSVW
jgi:hypothetical protein